MKRILCLFVTAACLVSAAEPLPSLIDKLKSEVKPQETMQFLREVYTTDRWFTFPKFRQTAEHLRDRLKGLGLKDVEIVDAPADGVTQVGFWTMPMAWDVKSATLELLDPDAPADMRMLANFAQVPSSLGMWSGPTPPGGITAEVVEYKKGANLKGKVVLTAQNSANLKWELVKAGALGAINGFSEDPALADGRQWINAWGDHGWAFTKTSTPLLSFSITPRQAAYVRKLLASGKPVRVHATVDTRYYSGSYPFTTAVIRGTSSDEEVLTLGHTSEQGAQDNATGVSALMESLAALNRLIAAGKLAPPRRTIRIMLMPEMYASLYYVGKYPDRVRRTVAAMCVDTPAASYDLPGTEYTWNLNPDSGISYTDAFVLRIAHDYLTTVGRPWHEHEYRTGTDAYLGEPSVGIPTTWPYSGSGVETHHNSEDTPDRVDPRSLRDLSIMNAAYLYYIAAAGEPEAYWLATVARDRGLQQVAKAKTAHIEQVHYAVDRQTDAVLSVLRLAAPGNREALRRKLAPLVDDLKAAGQKQAALVKPGPAWDPAPKEASSIVVKRKRYGTIPLDDLPQEQWGTYPSGAWAIAPAIALYWCDGHRNLAEVIRLTELELGPTRLDYVGYFRFLRDHGYVEFVQ